jgi:LmbE family N-acetylglucosaminyl deacetylase
MTGNATSADRSLLLCFAHPDDELGCGGLVARYVAAGARATLICATNGDVGTVDERYLRGYSSIAELRLAELRCATSTLGFTEVVTFGYRDSGMMGTADNEIPTSLWQAPLDEVTARVAEVMRHARPQVVITFNAYGAYGHPDHIKIHQATLAAFQQLQAEPEHPQKLYYNTWNPQLARAALRVVKLFGRDPTKLGRNKDVDLQASAEALTPITTRVRIPAGYLARTQAARHCHASQITVSPAAELLGRVFGPMVFGSTTLSRVIPPPARGERTERDLFDGLDVG